MQCFCCHKLFLFLLLLRSAVFLIILRCDAVFGQKFGGAVWAQSRKSESWTSLVPIPFRVLGISYKCSFRSPWLKVVVVVSPIYPNLTGQRQKLNLGRSAHFLLQ